MQHKLTALAGGVVYHKFQTRMNSISQEKQSSLRLKTYILIGIMVVAGPVGNLLVAKGMKAVGQLKFWPPAELLTDFVHVFGSPVIWLGIACLIAFIVAYMLALSVADYSYVQPAAALGYGVVAVLGYFVLHESVSPLRWVGIALICSGVAFVRNTHPSTTENAG